jgi:hypothetical protein
MRPKRKSRFQQRLEEIAQRLKDESPDPETPATLSAQHLPLPPGYDWISLEDEQPPYYSPIDLWDGKQLYEDWARVSNGEQDYYVNNRDNRIMFIATHWSKRAGVNYPPYEPMTSEDLPRYSQRDIDGIIIQLNTMIHKRTSASIPHIEYTTALEEAIEVINFHTKQSRMTRGLTY